MCVMCVSANIHTMCMYVSVVFVGKIGKFLDERKAIKFTDKLYNVFKEFQATRDEGSRKRKVWL